MLFTKIHPTIRKLADGITSKSFNDVKDIDTIIDSEINCDNFIINIHYCRNEYLLASIYCNRDGIRERIKLTHGERDYLDNKIIKAVRQKKRELFIINRAMLN